MSLAACSSEDFRAALAPYLAQMPARLSLLAGWAQRDDIPLFRAGDGFAALEPGLGSLVTHAWPAEEDAALLTEAMQCLGRPPSKIVSSPDEARRLAAGVVAGHGCVAHEAMHTACYRLAQLLPRVRPGQLRTAQTSEIAMLQDWDEAMALDAKLGQTEASFVRGLTPLSVERGRRRIWDDEGPRCTLGFVPVGSAWRIVLVYTPPQHRGRHYASAAVSALCSELLDKSGAGAVISLYADLDNPASNRVYRGIGFVLEGEQLSIELE